MFRIGALLGITASSSLSRLICAAAVVVASTGWATAQIRAVDERPLRLAQTQQTNQYNQPPKTITPSIPNPKCQILNA